MDVQRKKPTTKGPAEWFTGDVWIDSLGTGQASPAMGVGAVHFSPGARTAWHRHAIGQSLYVVEGESRVQAEGGPVTVIRAGDMVRIEGGERHWHGAAPDHFMTHLAMTEGDATWLEHVTDAEYLGSD